MCVDSKDKNPSNPSVSVLNQKKTLLKQTGCYYYTYKLSYKYIMLIY